jgi:hypothetical protein
MLMRVCMLWCVLNLSGWAGWTSSFSNSQQIGSQVTLGLGVEVLGRTPSVEWGGLWFGSKDAQTPVYSSKNYAQWEHQSNGLWVLSRLNPGHYTVVVWDASGSVLREQRLFVQNLDTWTFDFSDLAPGSYVLHWMGAGSAGVISWTQKGRE